MPAEFYRSAVGALRSSNLPDDLRKKILEWVYTLFAHDQNQKQTILRAATALGYGLDPEKYVSAYPGATVNIVTTSTVPEPTLAPAVPASAPVPVATPTPVVVPPTATLVPESSGGIAAKPPTVVPTPAIPRSSRPATVPKARPWPNWLKWLGVAVLTAAGAGIGWGVGTLISKPSAPASPPTNSIGLRQDWELKIVEPKP